MPTNSQKRVATTDQQRQMVRQGFKPHPNPQQALISWLASQPQGRKLTQDQFSMILSEKYEYFASDSQKSQSYARRETALENITNLSWHCLNGNSECKRKEPSSRKIF
ncbi:hypothetical protein K3495_g3470 [Podosphaera aphanis]|nr:hypothetical protein K3495_g3470 [Podosphaera aphanis]